MYKYQKQKNTSGFTLVELIISIGLFSVVMTMGVSALLTLISAHSRAQSLQIVTSNLSFAIDTMTRNIRTGFNYYCAALPDTGSLPSGSQDCTLGNTGIAFTESDTFDRAGYRLDVVGGVGRIQQKTSTGSWLYVTSNDIDIDQLSFFVKGTTSGDDEQPHALILIKANILSSVGDGTEFLIQTTVNQRLLDL